jgi:hypothetical protein
VAPFPLPAPNPSPRKEEACLPVPSLLDGDDDTLADMNLGSVLTPSPKVLAPQRRVNNNNLSEVATEINVDQDAWKW